MFSANENIALRQHKRRIIGYVEDCLSPEMLDRGANVMVMQVSCNMPGCVPLETAIMILFPHCDRELIEGIKESAKGGTLKTKILMPMAQVTKPDVLEALPPPLGTRSVKKLCYQARDVMLAQITQLMGQDDFEGRDMMAQYLQTCLEEYRKRGCVAPDYGEPFADVVQENKTTVTMTAKDTTTANDKNKPMPSGNFVFRHDPEDDNMTITTLPTNGSAKKTTTTNGASSTNGTSDTTNHSKTYTSTRPSSMDWRRQQGVEREMTSQSIISRLSEREHAPGVRMAGCPCCDPDNISNYVDSIMML